MTTDDPVDDYARYNIECEESEKTVCTVCHAKGPRGWLIDNYVCWSCAEKLAEKIFPEGKYAPAIIYRIGEYYDGFEEIEKEMK